jgi:alcohol dehydrogenase class IV
MNGDFDFPTRVVFGAGRARELPELVRGWGRRALIVTDVGVMGSDAGRRVLDALAPADLDYRVFEGVEPNPTEENVEAGLRRFQEGGDFLIALGGGSPMDAAKAIRLRSTHEGPLSRYDARGEETAPIRPDMPPLLAIPTTAGTGSEVGRSAVITLEGRKRVLFSPHLIPTLALCDPELTLDLPARITAGTGADALVHHVEAYFARGFHPMCDAIALDGMRRAMQALPVAVRDGGDLEARSQMMLAAMMGAVAFQKGLGVTHSLAHPLSSVAGVHHGVANAIMLPHALRFNRDFILPRAGAVAAALGVPLAPEPAATVERIAAALEALFAGIGLPSHLHQVSVTSALIPAMADLAMQDACHLLNPRPVERRDMEELYHAAL